MKKSQTTTKTQPQKKENKEKDKVKSKEIKKDAKENPKDKKKVQPEEDEFDYYTEEEIASLDKFHVFTDHKFEDDEIYDVMQKFNNDEELIKNELKEMLKVLNKGDEFNWTEIGKSKNILY